MQKNTYLTSHPRMASTVLASVKPVDALKIVPECLKLILRHGEGHRPRVEITSREGGVKFPFQAVVVACRATKGSEMDNLVFERTVGNTTSCGAKSTYTFTRLTCRAIQNKHFLSALAG